MPFRVKSIRRDAWQIVDENGHPVYDRVRDGKDKPVTFHDKDVADVCCETLNKEEAS